MPKSLSDLRPGDYCYQLTATPGCRHTHTAQLARVVEVREHVIVADVIGGCYLPPVYFRDGGHRSGHGSARLSVELPETAFPTRHVRDFLAGSLAEAA